MSDKIPTLSFSQLPRSIATLLQAKFERLGYLGEFFAKTAHQEKALEAFIHFTDASKGALDMRIVELIALSVATMKDIPYEKNQHERLSIRLGYGRDWIADVEALDPSKASVLSDEDKIVQRFIIDSVARDGVDVTEQLDAVVDFFGYENAVAVIMVMARYTSHALMVNCLKIGPPVPSIVEDGFGASPDGETHNE